MASTYDKKEYYRQKERNSREGNPDEIDGRQYKNRGDKKKDLLAKGRQYDDLDDIVSFETQLSFDSPDVTKDYEEFIGMRTPPVVRGSTEIRFPVVLTRPPMNEVSDDANLAQWITTDSVLLVIPLVGRYKNPISMKNNCRIAEPTVDNTILHDLQRAFPNLSLLDLSKLVLCCQKLPYWIRSLNGQLTERAKTFMSDHNLTEEQLYRVNEINKKIILRSSYGVLFVQANQFFTKANTNYKQRRSAIKGYPILKSTGEYENPWETAVRITEQDVQYLNRQAGEWQRFNMNTHIAENQRQNYLECLITGEKDSEVLRYVGLFIIRLRLDIEIRTNDYNQLDFTQNWYSIDEGLDNKTFFTILPFLKYLHENPDFV